MDLEETENFFFNASLSLFSATKLYNFNPDDDDQLDTYRRTLMNILRRNIKPGNNINPNTTLTIEEDIEWLTVPNTTGITRHFIFVHGIDRLIHRLCLVTSNTSTPGGLFITNCSPSVSSIILDWFQKSFDCQINRLSLPTSLLRSEYEKYLMRTIEASKFAFDSQLIFTSPGSTPELKKITISLPGEDVVTIYGLLKSNPIFSTNPTTPSIIDSIFEHLQRHTSISFDKLTLERINCGGFVLTTAGKLKLFKRDYTSDQVTDLITFILHISLKSGRPIRNQLIS